MQRPDPASLPLSPGVYLYKDARGRIIYVGKARVLRRRILSYFRPEGLPAKTRAMLAHAVSLDVLTTTTEKEALLLESSLIKKHRPHYNIVLRDDKQYVLFRIDAKHPFPRLEIVRKTRRDGARYFGPFTSALAARETWKLLHRAFALRRCSDRAMKNRVRPCLYHHMGQCPAPCMQLVDSRQYYEAVHKVIELLEGKSAPLLARLRQEMETASEALEFEAAARLRDQIRAVERTVERQATVLPGGGDMDVIGLFAADKGLALGIAEMRERYHSTSKEIILPFEIDLSLEGITLTVPQRGDKKTLLDLSVMNCKQYRFDRLKQAEKLNPEQKAVRLMKEIQEALHLPKMPYQIECFDNSNISGTDAVAACVVFKKMKPSKKDYRKYNIKTVTGPDDYASMKEVVRRRYTRLVEEQQPLPDLIITDGGRGQMEVVREVVEDELRLAIPIAGLAKDDRHRTNELLYGFPPVVVGMKTDSELFRLLTQIQDEVHRFAITFHRDKRSKHALHSELDDIAGIGPKTRDTLLAGLKSVKRIREADMATLAAVVGPAKAAAVHAHFHPADAAENADTTTPGTPRQ